MTLLEMRTTLAQQMTIFEGALAGLSDPPTVEQASTAVPLLDSVRDTLLTLRSTGLDSFDPTAADPYTTGSGTLASAHIRLDLWLWERDTRNAITDVYESLTEIRRQLLVVIRGQRRTLHTVRSGDTLQDLAVRYYGDFREWPRIAAHNDITPATALTPGTVLDIPDPS